jgi:DNA modification methylase
LLRTVFFGLPPPLAHIDDSVNPEDTGSRPTSREASRLSKEEHQAWFQQVWNGLTGESTKNHPAPYPEELAYRLVRMFSFVGDTVLDPFMGTGTTLLASARCNRNSIGVEIEPSYVKIAKCRLESELESLFAESRPQIVVCKHS